MKRLSWFLLVGAAALLAGCVVTSVCPFYTDKDVVFKPALVGDWLKAAGEAQPEVWKFEKSGERAYRFTLIEDDKATVMQTHAFKLQDQLFLDAFSLEQDVRVIPPHCLLRVVQLTPTSLRLALLDNDWLKQFLAANPKAIAHHLVGGDKPEDQRVVLTADTAALQQFILAHLKTEAAWKGNHDFQREQFPAGERKGTNTK